jgi:hypothetical protein
MGIVFIPLVVVAIGSGVFLQHAAEQFNRLTEQPVYKLQTTSRLQNQIRKTYSLAKDYAVTPSFALRSQFEAEAKTVEEIFVDILAKTFLGPPEYASLAHARREWQDGVVLANLIFDSGASKATRITTARSARSARRLTTLKAVFC